MNLKHNCGTIRDPLRFRESDGVTAERMSELIKWAVAGRGIPATVRIDTVSEGGLFGKEYPCVVVSHPNPPDSYFDHVIAVCGNIVYFYFFGTSAATIQANKREMRRNSSSLLSNLAGAMMSDNTVAYDTEYAWHNDLLTIYNELAD